MPAWIDTLLTLGKTDFLFESKDPQHVAIINKIITRQKRDFLIEAPIWVLSDVFAAPSVWPLQGTVKELMNHYYNQDRDRKHPWTQSFYWQPLFLDSLVGHDIQSLFTPSLQDTNPDYHFPGHGFSLEVAYFSMPTKEEHRHKYIKLNKTRLLKQDGAEASSSRQGKMYQGMCKAGQSRTTWGSSSGRTGTTSCWPGSCGTRNSRTRGTLRS